MSGKTKCGNCKGTGQATCIACEGRGEQAVRTGPSALWPKSATKCSSCRGRESARARHAAALERSRREK
jgi:DnaJ-class molecular chaperone